MGNDTQTAVFKHRGRPGLMAGILGCVFGTLGILTLGIVFVPLAALCSVIGLLRGVIGASVSGIAAALIGSTLTVVGFVFSPSLWLVASGLLVASQADRTTAPATSAKPVMPASGPLTPPRPTDAKAFDQKDIHDCDRLAGSPSDSTRATEGVPFDKIDTARAVSACADAVRSNPTNASFQFEYGRALDAAKKYDEAIRWYREAAARGYSAAQVGLGLIYYRGHGVPQNYSEAMQWLRKAAEQGNAVAQNLLGVMYVNGQGVSQNYAEAIGWYRKAADQGFAIAQSNLGGVYYQGLGVAQDYSEAMKWFRAAADQGKASDQRNIGAMYERGRGVAQDYAQAANWYRKAADQGNDVAEHNLGVLYRDGHGVTQNYAEAVEWFRRAAELGNANAQHDLGTLYYRGQGVETNYAEALRWFRAAADQGLAEAQYNLGEMYANGRGVQKTYVKAVEWYRKAAEQGNADAQLALDAINTKKAGEPAALPTAVQKQLAQIDRTFVCPEDLPSDETRSTAAKLLMQQLAAVQPSITVKEIAEYRVSLLQKHQCLKTLANGTEPPAQVVQRAPRNQDTASKILIEKDAVLFRDGDDDLKLIEQLANLVKAKDYRCDSVSAARPTITAPGFVLTCNKFRYTYDIQDKGGHWIVTAR